MPTTSKSTVPQAQNDLLLKELLSSMTRQPSQNMRKLWALNYIPPKHLRLPEYTYRDADDSDDSELEARRGRHTMLHRALTQEMTKVMSNMSLSQMDEEESCEEQKGITRAFGNFLVHFTASQTCML
eukprot:447922-Pyramimonas_sp.AAC.1